MHFLILIVEEQNDIIYTEKPDSAEQEQYSKFQNEIILNFPPSNRCLTLLKTHRFTNQLIESGEFYNAISSSHFLRYMTFSSTIEISCSQSVVTETRH